MHRISLVGVQSAGLSEHFDCLHVHLGWFLSLAHIILSYLKINGNRVSPAHLKVRSDSLKKVLQDNTEEYFLTPVVWLFLKYVFITCVSECFQTSVRVKSSPVLFKSNLKGLALQVFGKRAGIVVNFLSLYILKIAAFLLMNCSGTASRRGSHGAHPWSSVINSGKAPCASHQCHLQPQALSILSLPGLGSPRYLLLASQQREAEEIPPWCPDRDCRDFCSGEDTRDSRPGFCWGFLCFYFHR